MRRLYARTRTAMKKKIENGLKLQAKSSKSVNGGKGIKIYLLDAIEMAKHPFKRWKHVSVDENDVYIPQNAPIEVL